MVSAMLFYKKFKKDLIEQGFELNPYDPCVANKNINGNQITVCWHVDDLKVSHQDSKVVTNFLQWIKDTYGSIGKVKITRGKKHDYLGMKLDYSIPGKVKVDMREYVQSMIDDFPQKYLEGSKVASFWTDKLFHVDDKSKQLDPTMKEQFHTTTAKGLFLCKRARPDMSPAIAYFTTRVREPNENDWNKLTRMMKFLRQTKNDVLTLEVDPKRIHSTHVDAAYAIHPDMRSQSGGTQTLGKGVFSSLCQKQRMNTRSSTEAELVSVDDNIGPMLWTKRFLKHQGFDIRDSILYQDNRSAILLEKNGRQSAGKRSRHLDIRYFFVTDLVEKKEISIRYCPTDDMTADYMTKPTHGQKFQRFRSEIMNLNMPTATQLFMLGCLAVARD
jgi:hypothetical protein